MTKPKQEKEKVQSELIIQLRKSFEPIEAEVIKAMGNRSVFQEIIEISKNNKKVNKSNSFWDFIKEGYVALMVSAVCRQIDTDTRSSSLINFLNRLLDPAVAQRLTKDWYSKQYHKDHDIYPGFMQGLGRADFEEYFGSKDFIDRDIVRADINKLAKKTKKIKRFRNKRIAHRDKRNNLVFDVNFEDLDGAIETIRGITSKYYLLLEQSGNDLIPVDQTDWQEIFTIPWIEKRSL